MNKSREVIVSGMLLLFCATANAYDFNFKDTNFFTLEFNEKHVKPGIKEVDIKSYGIEHKFGGTQEVPEEELVCKYNEKGDIIEGVGYKFNTEYDQNDKKWVIKDSLKIFNSAFEYDGLGRLVKNTDSGNVINYKYDDKGALLEQEKFDSSGDPQEKKVYTYDAKGNCIREDVKYRFILQNSYLDKTSETYTYDAKNRKIQMYWSSAEGATTFPKKIVYKYDDNNRLKEEDYYADMEGFVGEKDQKPSVVMGYFYDDQGNIKYKTTVTSQYGDVVSAMAEYKYDEKGRIMEGDLSSIRVDKNKEQTRTPEGFYRVEYK